MGIAVLALALLCGGAVPAQEQARAAHEAPEKGGSSPPPLSKEDEDLVKDMALLEELDLLRNLDLFEEPEQPDAGPQIR